MGPPGPLVRFDWSSPSSSSAPSGGGTPAMLAGERLHRTGYLGDTRAQGIEAGTPVVVLVSGVDGAAGGELCSRRWPSGKVVFLPR